MLSVVRVSLPGFVLALMLTPRASAQRPVPTVDGDAGSCSVEFVVLDGNGAPVSDAQIRVQFDYGFLGMHQRDLQVATDSQGRARFTGLPDSVDGALFFNASTDTLRGVAVDDPSSECHAKHAIYMVQRSKLENAAE